MGRRTERLRKDAQRRRNPLRWLGLGALGLATAALVRGERRGRRPEAVPPPAAGDPAPVPRLEPPDDVADAWIAGPAGATLRFVERHPQGSLPVVFVHGLAGRAEQWSSQLAFAGPAIRAVALDLPGHGGSDPPSDADLSVGALAAAIGAVLDGLRLRTAVLVAHSLGASAAIEYADTHPKRVAGLLLVDPSGDQTQIPEAERQRLMEQLERDPEQELAWYFRQLLFGARPEVAARVLEQLQATAADVVLGALRGAQTFDPVPALRRFGGPVRSVISDLNSLPYSLHNLLPELDVHHVGGSSHWLMMDRPDDLWAILVDFLDRLDGSENATPAYC